MPHFKGRTLSKIKNILHNSLCMKIKQLWGIQSLLLYSYQSSTAVSRVPKMHRNGSLFCLFLDSACVNACVPSWWLRFYIKVDLALLLPYQFRNLQCNTGTLLACMKSFFKKCFVVLDSRPSHVRNTIQTAGISCLWIAFFFFFLSHLNDM